MKIELKKIKVKELSEGYQDNAEAGVIGFCGKLDIRPPFQREFVYKDKQRDAVINTITKDFPLNVMYWAVREDGSFEIIDGQQRTISIAQYIVGDFSINEKYFHSLTKDEHNKKLNYEILKDNAGRIYLIVINGIIMKIGGSQSKGGIIRENKKLKLGNQKDLGKWI